MQALTFCAFGAMLLRPQLGAKGAARWLCGGGAPRLPALEGAVAQRAAGLAAALPGLPARVAVRPERGRAPPRALRRARGRQPVPEPAARRVRMQA